jgi:thioredoxin-like negative regulator of GroEL
VHSVRRVLAACFVLVPSSAWAADRIEWGSTVEAAVRASAAQHKPLLVYFHAAWCAPCRIMEQATFPDPEVLAAAPSFVAVKVDADANVAFSKRYGVEHLPTVLMVDGSGAELVRMEGLVPGAVLAETMVDVASGYARYLAARSAHDGAALQSAGAYLLGLGNGDGAAGLLGQALALTDEKQVVLRERIRLDLAIIELSRNNVEAAAREFDQLSESTEPTIQQRALIGLLVSSHALEDPQREHRAMSLLARSALGIETPD